MLKAEGEFSFWLLFSHSPCDILFMSDAGAFIAAEAAVGDGIMYHKNTDKAAPERRTLERRS